ncbi:hypothetical protein [Pseudarthrobacter sp. H2]|uniref:hypothetical protein n=1 Tax=Pseudarthrobacter sp. H2 TaxID=3418415 RepID=UPI003CEEFC4D
MTTAAEEYAHFISVGTAQEPTSYDIITTTTGARTGCEAFPVSTAGVKRVSPWIRRNTTEQALAAVERTVSYG